MAKSMCSWKKNETSHSIPRVIIDIGSTSIRMIIAQVLPKGQIKTLDFLHQAVTLGRDTFTKGYITHESIEDCVTTLKSFRKVLDDYQISLENNFRAIATTAVREAENCDAFIDRVAIATGITVDIIDDSDIARCIYLSLQAHLTTHKSLLKKNVLLSEVSGGSSFILFLEKGEIQLARSHRLGTLRTHEMIESAGTPDILQGKVTKSHMQRTIGSIIDKSLITEADHLIALGGDIKFAALFHDIGYASNPHAHAEESARILLREDVPYLTPTQKRSCAAIILFHKKNSTFALNHQFYTSLKNKKQVLVCAALLRIADGLDHGHIQDTAIDSVRVYANEVTVALKQVVYHENITFASAKADVWENIFHKSISFREKKLSGGLFPFSHIIQPHNSFYEAIRRLLYFHFRIVLDNYLNALAEDDPEYLHDFRVYFRRFRMLLRFFQKYLPHQSVDRILTLLQPFFEKSGPVRDSDVRHAFFVQLMKKTQRTADIRWSRFEQWLNEQRMSQNALLQEVLSSDECSNIIETIMQFLRVELPEYNRSIMKKPPIKIWAEKGVRKYIRRIIVHERQTPHHTIEEMHLLRKKVRNCRYVTESLLGVLPKRYVSCAKQLKKCATLLGDIHDTDIFNGFILTAKETVPPDIRTILQEKRLYEEYVFQKVWKQFSTGKIVQEIIHKKFLTNKENGMTLYILRHGIAEQRSMQKPDRDRALIPKGRKKVERIIEKLCALSFEPDIILTSPYKRALETARIAAGKIPTAPPVKTTAAIKPSGSFDMLIQLIREKGAQSCCIVGHEPHLSSFASYLLTDTENVSITLKKAGSENSSEPVVDYEFFAVQNKWT